VQGCFEKSKTAARWDGSRDECGAKIFRTDVAWDEQVGVPPVEKPAQCAQFKNRLQIDLGSDDVKATHKKHLNVENKVSFSFTDESI